MAILCRAEDVGGQPPVAGACLNQVDRRLDIVDGRLEIAGRRLEDAGHLGDLDLEQISDWLTKILVGLGLTQFKAIGRFFNSVTSDVGKSLSGSTSSSTRGTVEATGLVLLAVATGFLFFYLWSRVYLPRMFQKAEQEEM